MTEAERIDRAFRAKRAVEEFVAPAFDTLRSEYGQRLKDVASRTPWDAPKITALANATRIVEEVERQMLGIVMDGEAATHDRRRAERIEQLSPARRRLMGIGI